LIIERPRLGEIVYETVVHNAAVMVIQPIEVTYFVEQNIGEIGGSSGSTIVGPGAKNTGQGAGWPACSLIGSHSRVLEVPKLRFQGMVGEAPFEQDESFLIANQRSGVFRNGSRGGYADMENPIGLAATG
jgi:hypothetical protein